MLTSRRQNADSSAHFTGAEYSEYCVRAFREARNRGASIVRFTIAAPMAPLLSHPEGSLLWSAPDGTQLVASGSVATLTGSGDTRFDDIKAAAQDLWSRLADVPQTPELGHPPRLFGGLSFAPVESAPPWSDLGQARFWLPELLYGKNKDRAWLSLCADVDACPQVVASELATQHQRLSLASSSTPKQAQIDRTEHLDAETWKRRVQDIRSAITTGGVRKVVAARLSKLFFRDGIELRPALERLIDRYQDCYCFAFRVGEVTFLGASPETLISKQGTQLSTQALAGSIAAQLPNAGAQLLASDKDRFEQDLVVQAITEALSPLCKTLEHPSEPEPLTLRHLTHLCTAIEGQLDEPCHILDLVAALHPTPAVGGSPARQAMDWIEEHEDDRGWYAGPVGWFDEAGDGHFAVAIRSALFTGTEALIYAGAGIVGDSDPDLEYQETGLKQRAILDALGIRG